MRHFSPDHVRTPDFDPRHYNPTYADDVFVCLVHASDINDEIAAYTISDMLDHFGATEREQRLNLLEAFGSDSGELLEILGEIAEATGSIEGGIHSSIEISDDESLTNAQRELVLSVDGAGPDQILEAGRRARLELQDSPQAQDCLLELEDHQLAADSARDQLVKLLLKHEPAWHKQRRDQDALLYERFKNRPDLY